MNDGSADGRPAGVERGARDRPDAEAARGDGHGARRCFGRPTATSGASDRAGRLVGSRIRGRGGAVLRQAAPWRAVWGLRRRVVHVRSVGNEPPSGCARWRERWPTAHAPPPSPPRRHPADENDTSTPPLLAASDCRGRPATVHAGQRRRVGGHLRLLDGNDAGHRSGPSPSPAPPPAPPPPAPASRPGRGRVMTASLEFVVVVVARIDHLRHCRMGHGGGRCRDVSAWWRRWVTRRRRRWRG